MSQTSRRRDKHRSLKSYKLFKTLRPALEAVRDTLGKTKVYNVEKIGNDGYKADSSMIRSHHNEAEMSFSFHNMNMQPEQFDEHNDDILKAVPSSPSMLSRSRLVDEGEGSTARPLRHDQSFNELLRTNSRNNSLIHVRSRQSLNLNMDLHKSPSFSSNINGENLLNRSASKQTRTKLKRVKTKQYIAANPTAQDRHNFNTNRKNNQHLEMMYVAQLKKMTSQTDGLSDNTNGTTGSVVTQFSMVESTASGASASIFKTYQDGSLECVAVKRIKGEVFEDHKEELEQLLNRERGALLELHDSPFITKFYQYLNYHPENEHWLIMEFCDGGSIIELIRSKIELNQIAAIISCVLRALEYIHDQGYIHGDIKCANILLCNPGIVKVCDFGLATKVKGVAKPDYHALGTVDYMAPEVMKKSIALDEENDQAETFKYSHKIDIWAVGIVVLELLVGNPPLHSFRRLEEDSFSEYISKMPEYRAWGKFGDTHVNSGLCDLFFPWTTIDDIIEDYYVKETGKRPPKKDIVKLVERFPELLELARDKRLRLFLEKICTFKFRPSPAEDKELFQFNEAEFLGFQKKEKMYAVNKCLSFVAQCLLFYEKNRPEAGELGQHPFVRNTYKEWKKIEPYVDSIMYQNNTRAGRKTMFRDFASSTTMREVNKILVRNKNKMKAKLFPTRLHRNMNGGGFAEIMVGSEPGSSKKDDSSRAPRGQPPSMVEIEQEEPL